MAQGEGTEKLIKELAELDRKWKDLRSDPEFEGHSGSPGEWMIERMDEIETELKRRGVAIPAVAG